MLSRTRDVDPSVRRLVYVPVLEQAENVELTKADRENITRTGLKDRDSVVRSAAVKLIGSWLDSLSGDLQKFVGLLDFTSNEDKENSATMALLSLFESRSDIVEALDFGGMAHSFSLKAQV